MQLLPLPHEPGQPVTLNSTLDAANHSELAEVEAETRELGYGDQIDAIDTFCAKKWII